MGDHCPDPVDHRALGPAVGAAAQVVFHDRVQHRAQHAPAVRQMMRAEYQQIGVLFKKHVASEIVAIDRIRADAFVFETHFAQIERTACVLPCQAEHRADRIFGILPPLRQRRIDHAVFEHGVIAFDHKAIARCLLHRVEITGETAERGRKIGRAEKQKAQGPDAVRSDQPPGMQSE